MDLTKWAWLIVPLGVTRAMQITLWDRITAAPRAWLGDRLNPDGYLGYLIRCPWCISVWIGALTVALTVWGTTREWTLRVLAALALSLVAVVLDRVIDRVAPDDPAPTVDPGPVLADATALPVGWVDDSEPVPPAVAAALDEMTGDDLTWGN